MRSRFIGLVAGLGLVAATVAPALACAFHDQQASAQSQQTAQAQQGSTTTQ
jgi:hypothetical protein